MTTITEAQAALPDEVVTQALVRRVELPYGAGVAALITLDNGKDHTRPSTFGPAGLASLDSTLDEIATWTDVVASRLLDTSLCPRCGQAVLRPGVCDRCGADLSTGIAADVLSMSQQIAQELLGPYGQLAGGDARAIDHGQWSYGYLRARGNTIEAGTSEIQRNIIGHFVLGLPRSY